MVTVSLDSLQEQAAEWDRVFGNADGMRDDLTSAVSGIVSDWGSTLDEADFAGMTAYDQISGSVTAPDGLSPDAWYDAFEQAAYANALDVLDWYRKHYAFPEGPAETDDLSDLLSDTLNS